MTWVKLDDSFYDNPKLEVIPDVAFRMWVCAIGYCGRHLTDGFIPVTKLSRIVAARRHQSVIKVLVDAGLFEQVEGGYIVHDYLQYNPSRDEVVKEREGNARRQSDFRTRSNALVTPLVTPLKTAPRTRPVVPKGTSTDTAVDKSTAAVAVAPPAPVEETKKIKGVNLASLFAAFTAAGLPRPIIPKQDHRAAGDLLQQVGPDAIVGCWMDISNGVWPLGEKGQWMRDNRSIGTIAPRINNWIDFKNGRNGQAPGKTVRDGD